MPTEKLIFFVETWFPLKRRESVRAGQENLSHWQNLASLRYFSPHVHKSSILTTNSGPADIFIFCTHINKNVVDLSQGALVF